MRRPLTGIYVTAARLHQSVYDARVSASARKVRVTGRVQGVFFRAWTQQRAVELGVNGWVRNCPDGSVEAHLEGDEAEMKALIQRMHEGPPAARVDQVEVEEVAALGITGFKARG